MQPSDDGIDRYQGPGQHHRPIDRLPRGLPGTRRIRSGRSVPKHAHPGEGIAALNAVHRRSIRRWPAAEEDRAAGSTTQIIRTERGAGYVFTAAVKIVR